MLSTSNAGIAAAESTADAARNGSGIGGSGIGGSDVQMAFSSLNDLQAIVRRARPSVGWEGVQLSREPIQGSLISHGGRKTRLTGTRASGGMELQGALSHTGLSLCIGIDIEQPGLFWRSEIGTGSMVAIQQGTEIKALFRSGASYLTMDIDHQTLEDEMLQNHFMPQAGALTSSAVLPGRIPPPQMAAIQQGVAALHGSESPDLPPGYAVEQIVLTAMVGLFSRQCTVNRDNKPCNYARTVARARDYIEGHISRPISIDELCRAACASKRTLHRAFVEVTGNTPQQYILKLRLNRIRRDLASAEEAERTVTVVSMRWGITELGRLAARYKEQFGELPSDTLHRRRGSAAAIAPEIVPGFSNMCAPPAPLVRAAQPQLRHDLHCKTS